MTNVSSAVRVSVVLWLTVWTGQWFCAWSWGPLADEALYWEWGRHLAWGYLDQPPAIAGWAALLSSSHAPSIGVLRLSSVASAAVIAVALSKESLFWIAIAFQVASIVVVLIFVDEPRHREAKQA